MPAERQGMLQEGPKLYPTMTPLSKITQTSGLGGLNVVPTHLKKEKKKKERSIKASVGDGQRNESISYIIQAFQEHFLLMNQMSTSHSSCVSSFFHMENVKISRNSQSCKMLWHIVKAYSFIIYELLLPVEKEISDDKCVQEDVIQSKHKTKPRRWTAHWGKSSMKNVDLSDWIKLIHSFTVHIINVTRTSCLREI